jgi:hypothetical protein
LVIDQVFGVDPEEFGLLVDDNTGSVKIAASVDCAGLGDTGSAHLCLYLLAPRDYRTSASSCTGPKSDVPPVRYELVRICGSTDTTDWPTDPLMMNS